MTFSSQHHGCILVVFLKYVTRGRARDSYLDCIVLIKSSKIPKNSDYSQYVMNTNIPVWNTFVW